MCPHCWVGFCCRDTLQLFPIHLLTDFEVCSSFSFLFKFCCFLFFVFNFKRALHPVWGSVSALRSRVAHVTHGANQAPTCLSITNNSEWKVPCIDFLEPSGKVSPEQLPTSKTWCHKVFMTSSNEWKFYGRCMIQFISLFLEGFWLLWHASKALPLLNLCFAWKWSWPKEEGNRLFVSMPFIDTDWIICIHFYRSPVFLPIEKI